MKRYAMIIDVAKCENCNNCFLSCKDEHCDNNWPGYTAAQPLHGHRWMNLKRRERGEFPTIDVAYRPTPCMHCDDPPCLKAAENGAVSKREDGIVLIDPDKARGQKALVASCPYGAIWWNDERQLAQKCTFCAHLLDEGWEAPRCVQSCPTGALSFFAGDDQELHKKVSEEHLQVLTAGNDKNCRPRCYYKNLYRYSHCFLAGSIAQTEKGLEDCVSGAKLLLKQKEAVIAEQLSDDFGDFKFDNLEKDSGEYLIEIIINGEIRAKERYVLGTSGSVGTIMVE